MGILKKAKKLVKAPRRILKKVIPKEIRPFLPYIAAAMGPAGLAASGIFANPAVTKALIAAGTRYATDDEADLKDLGITAALAASPDLISSGSGKLATKLDPRLMSTTNPSMEVGKLAADTARGLRAVEKGVKGASALKTIGVQGSLDAASKLKEIEQEQMDAYNRKLMEDGIRSKAERRSAIRNIYTGIGYDEDYVDSMLDRFGYKEGGGIMSPLGAKMSTLDYAKLLEELREKKKKEKEKEKKADGGRIGFSSGRSVARALIIRDLMGEGLSAEEADAKADELLEQDEEAADISKYTGLAEEGFKSAFGVESLFPQAPKPMGITPGFGNLPRMADGGDVMSPEEYFKEKDKFKKRKSIDDMMEEYEEYLYRQKYGPRDSAAEGGLMNLGGNEMDLRGGGFVPIGKKEKADDVPARLSKNEFVMTADAVRGAGGGDVNEGARRMYQTMDKLEAMA